MGKARPLRATLADKGFVTVSELVAQTGMASLTLYRLINRRKVRAAKVGKLWFVELASLAAHLGPEVSELLGIKPTRPLLPPGE